MKATKDYTIAVCGGECVGKDGINVFIDRQKPFTEGESGKNKNTTILLVTAGTAHIELDFKSYDLQPLKILMLPPSCLFCCTEQSDDFTVSCITFTKEITEELTNRFEPSYFGFLAEYPVGDIPEAEAVQIVHMMEGVQHVLQNKEMEHGTQIAHLLLQCFYLSQYDYCKQQFSTRETQGISNQEHLFMRFLTLIHEHASHERELAFYADKLCISNRYLSAIVRNQTGKTAKEFIDNRCIQEIKIRLRTTTNSLQSIAYDMNFPDQSFFSRYFKKNTGMTPKEFRAS